MLYITTRDQTTTYTAHHTLAESRGPDGGRYIPLQLPRWKPDMERLKEKSFCRCVAEVLNYFFSARLSPQEVASALGGDAVHLLSMSHRIVIAETWHNPDGDFSWAEKQLAARICGTGEAPQGELGSWPRIAIRIAVLFGLFGELARLNLVDAAHPMDISVPAGDLSIPMSAWYAREMGLPIGMILCACGEGGQVWELLYHGELRTADAAIPPELERLIYGALGPEETARYVQACRRGSVYSLPEPMSAQLRQDLFAAVVGQARVEAIIRNVFRSNAYPMAPDTALAYCGLQDYRAGVGERRSALILAEHGPKETEFQLPEGGEPTAE